MRPEASRVQWRTATMGMAVFGVLVGLWILLPSRAPARERISEEVIASLHLALQGDDRAGLLACREMLRASVHRDLWGRSLPGLLRLVEALLQVDRRCETARTLPERTPDAFDAGVCALRQGRYRDAIAAFVAVPKERGGAAFVEVAVGLLRARMESDPSHQGAPWPLGRPNED